MDASGDIGPVPGPACTDCADVRGAGGAADRGGCPGPEGDCYLRAGAATACAFTGGAATRGGKNDARLVPQFLGEFRFGDDLLGLDEDDLGARRVVGRMLVRHPDAACGGDRERASQHRFEGLTGHHAGPQDARDLARGVDDGRLDADLAGAAVQHEVDGITELRTDVVRGGGADLAEAVDGRGCDTAAEGRQQREGDRVVGHSHGHRLQPTVASRGTRRPRRRTSNPSPASPAAGWIVDLR